MSGVLSFFHLTVLDFTTFFSGIHLNIIVPVMPLSFK